MRNEDEIKKIEDKLKQLKAVERPNLAVKIKTHQLEVAIKQKKK